VTDVAEPASEELASSSLVELIVARLSREILSGNTDPGERLIEEHLTRRFGISRAPLREALRLLAQQGLVEHVPRRGVRVATLSERDVEELYEVRDVIERHAIVAAFKDGSTPDLSPVTGALDTMRDAAGRDDVPAVTEAHRAFHVAVVALAGNRQLTSVYQSVVLKIQLYMALNLRREADRGQQLGGLHRHERLVQALSCGDAYAVLAELTAHGARAYVT
jgi:DNA-binding GntR family transcriptional regulator